VRAWSFCGGTFPTACASFAGIRRLRGTAILTLALEFGATTTIFSAVYSLLLRPLPYPGANRLVTITPHSTESPTNLMPSPDFSAARNGLGSFEDVGGYLWRNRNVTGVGDPVRVNWVGVSANFLPMLRVVPQLGRVIRPDEDRRDGLRWFC